MGQSDNNTMLRQLIGSGKTPFQVIAHVLANRHKLSLIWELTRGPKRFKELERALAPVTAKVLTRSLRDLESLSLIERRSFDVSPPRVEYHLSASGVSLRPHIIALCKWAFEHVDTLMPAEASAEVTPVILGASISAINTNDVYTVSGERVSQPK